MFVLLLACREPLPPPPDPPGAYSGAQDAGAQDSGDTAGDSGDTAALPGDADADGYVAWDLAADPSLADCDDADPAVTPATERLVPAGPFTQGGDAFADTRPVREVTLSAYCLDVLEVTHADFLDLLLARAAAGHDNLDDEGRTLYDEDDADDEVEEGLERDHDGAWTVLEAQRDLPVVEVWQWSGEAYCAWRGKRLPTEAEWEKGARGTDARRWPWGDEPPTCARANVRPGGNPTPGDPGTEPCVGGAITVGSYPDGAGPYGHLDLAGNAAEWVGGWYRADAYADTDLTDPTGPESGWGTDDAHPEGYEARLTRGGNAVSAMDTTETTYRFVEPSEATSNGVSFRCARPLGR